MKGDETISELLYFFSFVLRWQKGKLLLLASLSCWIIFTLPLGFVQPPPTSCMVRANETPYLEASNREQRIVKRSTDLDELYYPENKEEYLEVASNVVFERLRRSTDDNEIFDYMQKPKDFSVFGSYDIERNSVRDFDNGGSTMYDLRNNRVRRQTSVTDKDDLEDLDSESNVNDENRGIDLETLQKQNRPADILEYKRFMKVQTLVFFYA